MITNKEIEKVCEANSEFLNAYMKAIKELESDS